PGATQSLRGARLDRHSSGCSGLFAQLPARPAAIRGAEAEADRDTWRGQTRRGRRRQTRRDYDPRRTTSQAWRRERASGTPSEAARGSDSSGRQRENVRPRRARGREALSIRTRLGSRWTGWRGDAADAEQPARTAGSNGKPAEGRDASAQHGAMALASPRSGELLCNGQYPGIHVARGR